MDNTLKEERKFSWVHSIRSIMHTISRNFIQISWLPKTFEGENTVLNNFDAPMHHDKNSPIYLRLFASCMKD